MSTLQIQTPRVYVPLLADARYKGAYGGRGSGKSHNFAEMLIEECIREKTDAVCLREIQKSLKFSVKKLLENKISSMNAGAYFEVQNEQIKSAAGGVIIFQGMQDHTSESIKSLEGFKIAWFEEAQTASQRTLPCSSSPMGDVLVAQAHEGAQQPLPTTKTPPIVRWAAQVSAGAHQGGGAAPAVVTSSGS